MKLYSNPAYLTMSIMFFLFVMGALYMFGNVAGRDINNAIQTGDTSFIQVEKWLNPTTYGKDIEKKVNNYESNSNEVKAGDPHDRFN